MSPRRSAVVTIEGRSFGRGDPGFGKGEEGPKDSRLAWAY
jgi:hypothetical protein